MLGDYVNQNRALSILVTLIKTDVAGLGCQKKAEDVPKVVSKVGQWLQTMNLSQNEGIFLDNGYDDLDFLNGILDEGEIKFLGVSGDEVATVLKELENLPNKISEVQKRYPAGNHNNNNSSRNINNNNNNNNIIYDKDFGEVKNGEESGENEESSEKDFALVDSWLDSIHLGIYKETFKRHSYLDMERIKRIWEIELSSVLEITKRGHRRRILASVNAPYKGEASAGPNLEEITADLSQLVSFTYLNLQ